MSSHYQSLGGFLVMARQMREVLKVAEENECKPDLNKIWRRLQNGVTLDGKGRLRAKTLIHHCYLEIIGVRGANLKFYSCANRQCDVFGLQRKLGERGRSHKYCSDACRKAAERERSRLGKGN